MLFNLYTLFLITMATTVSLAATVNRNYLPLSSKVVFQSPTIENVYKEFVLSSKPLNLKKYATAKPKNSQKDSKIYFIPIGPMPYRFTPGVGYDYQPMRINPILKVPKQPTTVVPNGQNIQNKFPQSVQHYVPQGVGSSLQQNNAQNYTPNLVPNRKQIFSQKTQQNIVPNSQPGGLANTKMTRLNGQYYFNGRPFRLQAYRAAPKLNVDKYNLQSNLFFNKNIIY